MTLHNLGRGRFFSPFRLQEQGSQLQLSALQYALVFLLAAVLSLAAAGGAMAAQEWVVKRVKGTAYFVAPGVDAFQVRKGMVFQKGYTIATRKGARALIARSGETISVGPDTTFAISKHRSNGVQTTLLQRKGVIDVDVKKRSRPHFTVETPFMAAVVKGTAFNVTVRGKEAKVRVDRGVVQVEDFSSGDRADLSAGQSAASAPTKGAGLSVDGKTKPAVTKGRKRAPVFETPKVANIPGFTETARGKGLLGGRAAASKSNGNRFGRTARSVNGSAGAQGNGNGNGNGNGGGNGNGNGGGNGNGNGGGNGNGNGGGNGNGNGGGNGNGNGGGNGNGNGGGNGNGNGGGNGNGNGGGNGNGNGGGKK